MGILSLLPTKVILYLHRMVLSVASLLQKTYMNERILRLATKLHVILKGYYQKTSIPSNSTRVSYYKIDLVDSHAAKELLDIERNYHYIIQVNNVAMEGYPHLTGGY